MLGYGPGRLSVLSDSLSLCSCVDMIKSHLRLSHVRLARAVGQHLGTSGIEVLAVADSEEG